ncbi:hypothetical protein DK853_43290, partial [Klebsiella oxytoca]
MYKEKFSGIICEINSIDNSYRAELEMDELNRAILIISKNSGFDFLKPLFLLLNGHMKSSAYQRFF